MIIHWIAEIKDQTWSPLSQSLIQSSEIFRQEETREKGSNIFEMVHQTVHFQVQKRSHTFWEKTSISFFVVFQSKKRHEFHVVTNDTAIYGMSSVFFLAHCHPGIFSVGKTVSTTNKKTMGKKIGPQQKPMAFLFVFHLFRVLKGGAKPQSSAFAKYLASSGRKGRYCGDSRSKHLMSRWSGEIKAAGLNMLNKTESYRGEFVSHRIHVWNIYLHLSWIYCKCR